MIRTQHKIVERNEAKELVTSWKNNGKEVVFTNGCFDIIHLGHVDYLQKARNLGDKLVLGLNSDSSVRELKGETRPINIEEARARVLASMEFVDLVIIFGEETPLSLINELIPDVLVKGKDYEIGNIVGADVVMEHGGKVETIEFVDGFSTTNIINRIKE